MTKTEVTEHRNLNLKLEELKARKAEIKKSVAEHRDSLTDKEIQERTSEAVQLKKDIENVEKQIKDLEERSLNKGEEKMNYLEKQKEIEERANKFVETNRMTICAGKDGELRSALLSSGTLKPLTNQVEINDIANNGLCGILNDIYIQDLYGTGGNEIPYVVSESSANEGTEGEAPEESDPVFATIKVTPTNVDTLAYVSRRIKKLSPVQYEAKVRSLALKALRKKVISLISTGTAGTVDSKKNITVSGIEGIKSSTLNAKLDTLTEINDTTLRDIVLAYGGDDEVAGGATLQLSKADLQKFGAVRGKNEKKAVYEIAFTEGDTNSGTIKDGGTVAKFRINSNLTSGTMVYGQMPHYELDLYGDYEITTSEDYKFAEGLIAIKGNVDVSGAVTCKNGFLVITIKSSTTPASQTTNG